MIHWVYNGAIVCAVCLIVGVSGAIFGGPGFMIASFIMIPMMVILMCAGPYAVLATEGQSRITHNGHRYRIEYFYHWPRFIKALGIKDCWGSDPEDRHGFGFETWDYANEHLGRRTRWRADQSSPFRSLQKLPTTLASTLAQRFRVVAGPRGEAFARMVESPETDARDLRPAADYLEEFGDTEGAGCLRMFISSLD